MGNPVLDRAVNVEGRADVLAEAKAAMVARFVFLSTSGGIYGEADSADEATLPRTKSYYSVYKYLAERCVEMSRLSYDNVRLARVRGWRGERKEAGS